MITLPLLHLAYLLLPLLIFALLANRWEVRFGEIPLATFRMAVQLLAVGWVLTAVFSSSSLLVGCAVMAVMLGSAVHIALRPMAVKGMSHYCDVALALALPVGGVLLFLLLFVLDTHPRYQPRVVIPLAGMLFANAMNAISLAGERFQREIATEMPIIARNRAFKTALIPQINGLLAVGIVSLPGMMTGQILSGVSPLLAVRYQIMVMGMLLISSGFATMIYLVRRVKATHSPLSSLLLNFYAG